MTGYLTTILFFPILGAVLLAGIPGSNRTAIRQATLAITILHVLIAPVTAAAVDTPAAAALAAAVVDTPAAEALAAVVDTPAAEALAAVVDTVAVADAMMITEAVVAVDVTKTKVTV